MSESLIFDTGGAIPYQTTEHYLRRVLAGDLESVRSRIVLALERLGYDLVDDDETTVRGRRAATGWGKSYSSADVLDYPRTLVIKLKPSGNHATRITFDYLVKHPSLSTGEKDILTREAEAISSLATVRNRERYCVACGTESTDDSRFCRRCGAPMTAQNTELELLNMAAEIRSGLTSVAASEIAVTASTILTGAALIVILSKGIVLGPGINAILVIAMSLLVLTTIFLGFGLNRIMRSLKRPDSKVDDFAVMQMVSRDQEKYLPDSNKGYISVTEGTTSLLDDSPMRVTTSDLNDRRP